MDISMMLLAIFNLLILLFVMELVRRRKLKEKYSILWLCAALVMIFFSLSRELLHSAARLLGIQYPPSLIFLIAFLFLIIINIHFSVVISELSDKNKTLAQELAIMKSSTRRHEDAEME